MSRLIKSFLSFGFLAILVVAISFAASKLLRPNQRTPIVSLIPVKTKSVNLNPQAAIQTVAAWIWQPPEEVVNQTDTMIKFAKTENINTVYLYIDEYIDIYELPAGIEKDQKMNSYMGSLRQIISKFTAAGIKVHALSGNPAYSYDSHSYIPPILIRHVFDFNQQNPQTRFAGIQFDIEFYEDPRFFDSPQEYTDSYLKLISDSAGQINNLSAEFHDSLRLGFVIPFWFDEANEYLQKPIIKDIINSLSSTPGTYLVIMSYRKTVDGEGGVLAISKNELEAASGTPVTIVIAQELVENKDPKITRFGESKSAIEQDLLKIITAAKAYPNYEGISVHDLPAFMLVN